MKAFRHVITLSLVLSATPALAEGGFSFAVEGLYIIDFLILVGLIWAMTKGPLRKFFRARHDAIASEMEAATRLREQAEARLAELDQALSGLEAEIGEIRTKFQEDGEREKARIIAQAEAEAARIQANTTKSLEQEAAKLRQELEKELIDTVMADTEAKVRAQINPMSQNKLTKAYLNTLTQLESLDGTERAA